MIIQNLMTSDGYVSTITGNFIIGNGRQIMNLKPPSELSEHLALMKWASLKKIILVHCPNEGPKSARYGAILKKMGVSKGFPDLSLYEARGGYFGLFIELKADRKYSPSEKLTGTWIAQEEWLARLASDGYLALMCFGWVEASRVVEKYISWGRTESSLATSFFPDVS